MELIKDTVQQVLKTLRAKDAFTDKCDPETVLKNILTKRELGHIKVKYFKSGILYLAVDSSSWLYNFNLKKQVLQDGLRAKIPVVKEVRLRLGEVEKSK